MSYLSDWVVNGPWMLVGPDDDMTPEWLAQLLNTRGTVPDWRSIGWPLKFDERGNPQPVQVWGRWLNVVLVGDEEAVDFPLCTSRGVRVPDPIPAAEPEE